MLSICTTTLKTYNIDVINGCLFFHIFKIDKNKHDEYMYIWHVYCVHYILSNIVMWVAKRHLDLWVNSRNSSMLNSSINISNTFLCDSLFCIHPNPMHIPYYTICGRFELTLGVHPSGCILMFLSMCKYITWNKNILLKTVW